MGFAGFFPLYSEGARNTPIDVNLIIDGSEAFSEVSKEASAWISDTLIDRLLATGDKITVWSAGGAARVVYSETIKSDMDRENVKKILRGLSPGGNSADFSGALREASSKPQFSGISYTLLISSSASLSSTLQGPQANLMRFSRIEEFRGWRALTVGLNIDSKVRKAAASFM